MFVNLVHQPIIPTITTTLPNVYVLGNQPMNLSIGHMVVLVSHQLNLWPLVTPFVLRNISTLPISTYQCGIMSNPFTLF
jgi:hypothetical protein